MATVKDEIRRMIESLPDNATWEDVQYSIYFRNRIERGRAEAAEGKVIGEDEVEQRMKPWHGARLGGAIVAQIFGLLTI